VAPARALVSGFILASLAACAACHRDPTSLVHPAPADAGRLANDDAVAARAVPRPPPAPTPAPETLAHASHRRAADAACPDDPRAMAAGRNLVAQGDYQGAIEAFTEALRARPGDAHAWAELGYAALLAGKDAEPALLRARSLAHDPALLAQIWWNEALLRERQGPAIQSEPDAARHALVMAEAYGSSAATKKLGDASRCVASWVPETSDRLSIVSTWVEINDAVRQLCEPPEPRATTEATAKVQACRKCIPYQGADGFDETACDGPGPWYIGAGDHTFRETTLLVQPLGGGRYYLGLNELHGSYEVRPSAPPLERSGDAFVQETETDQTEEIELSEPGKPRMTFEPMLRDDGFWSDDPEVDAGAFCSPKLAPDAGFKPMVCMGCGQPTFRFDGPRELRYYARGTGQERLRLTVWHGEVKAVVHGDVATISGGGCSANVLLGANDKR
jgi:hypothetical protein